MSTTPESNLNKITKLEGEMSTLKAEIAGQMQVQSNNIGHMKESSERIEKSVERISEHCTKLFELQDEHGKSIVKLDERQESEALLAIERDKGVQAQITNGFTNLTTSMATEKQNAKDTKSDKKWRIATFLTVAGLIVTIIIALL